MRNKNRLFILVNWITTLSVLTVNALANILPINGIQTGQVSRDFETLFTPSGFTFSIWSTIYLGLIFFLFFSSSFFNSRNSSFISKLNHSVWISNVMNISWILAWHYYWIGASLIIMLGLLSSLVYINITLHNHRLRVKNHSSYFWFVRVPYSLYLGWIVVATVANFSVFLTYIQWQGLGVLPEFWLAIVLVIGTLIATLLVFNYKLYASGLAVAWGVYGISTNLIAKNEDLILIYLSYCLIGVILVSIIFKVRSPQLNMKF